MPNIEYSKNVDDNLLCTNCDLFTWNILFVMYIYKYRYFHYCCKYHAIKKLEQSYT